MMNININVCFIYIWLMSQLQAGECFLWRVVSIALGATLMLMNILLMLLVLDDPLLLHTNSMLSTINNKRNKIVNRAAEGEGI